MTELLKNFTFQDGTIAVCAMFLIFLLGFRLYWNRNKGEFIEIEAAYMPTYKLKHAVRFYSDKPTINKTQIHTPNVLVTKCMQLLLTQVIGDYYEFEIYCFDCMTEGEARRNRQTVYYKKELFDNLDKIEIG